eukprot:11654191-Ditylum_brightwellii.AAC.2
MNGESKALTALTVEDDGDDDNEEFVFFGQEHEGISKWWMLLDSKSTCSVMCNEELVKNIWEVDNFLTIKTYGGTTKTNLRCDVPGFGEAWFHKNCIANIIALHKTRKKFRITYNSSEGAFFTVHKPEYDVYFLESEKGQYYHYMSNPEVNLCITTVEGSKKLFTR